ncbi:hypothetical protein G7Z17_g1821 [Cylindrodendrum hubeiense]|uniref:WD-like domain-containing protein n=1 Tax=Cylindrodendrum hubeiense TaxID=595255 RepID=A0A9P5HPF8_9HYPO|nr:hypothetical protein G7Z17_g1821 [Cylindrodendrum hubeiense]
MHVASSITLAMGSLSLAANLDYADSIHALSYGNVQTQGESGGIVWFNVTGFAPDKLPHIQQSLGVQTMDNIDALKTIAGLASVAAREGKWGDIVYLYNVFAMNGHAPYADASSSEMRDGLLSAVTKADKSGVDSDLIGLYIETSSSPLLVEAFNALQTTPAPSATPALSAARKRWNRAYCDNAHKAVASVCRTLVDSIHFNVSVKSGGPRNICRGGCCISWSANATFKLENLYNASDYCLSYCHTANISCEVYGVELQGTVLDQCLSNRANGCT